MGTFIEVTIARDACADATALRKLVALCPVDVFRCEGDEILVDEDRVDECTLCGLCWKAFPKCIKVAKLY